MSSRSFKLDMSGPGRRDTLNSRNVGRLHKWNDKESRVKMSQVERKRIGVKLDRRRLKELLAEEPTEGMTIAEENSFRADLHMKERLDEETGEAIEAKPKLTPEEEHEQNMEAIKEWNEQFRDDDWGPDNFLNRLDDTLLNQDYDLDDDIDQRELVDFFG